jgi:2-dehydro-3-deoxygluconokinase
MFDLKPQSIFDVIALGEAMLEFNQTDPQLRQYTQGFGGDTSNAIIAAARAGARTAYLTRVGNDWLGQELIDLWRTEGVDTRWVDIDPTHATGAYFVSHGPQGHTFSYLRQGSAASAMTPAWLPLSPIADAKILHVSGISLAISASATDTVLAAMRHARAHGTLVALDANLRLKLWPLEQARRVLLEAMSLCDLFLPSREDVEALMEPSTTPPSPADILRWCHAHGAEQVVLKLGGEGCVVSAPEQDIQHQAIAARQVPVVDATGAGDCFSGNLLAHLAAGDDLMSAARYANAAASLAVQGFGAVAPLPQATAVQSILSRPATH